MHERNQQWFLIETEEEYNKAISRYEQIKDATAGADHKEKLLLVHLIENYENSLWDLPEVNPVEMIKIRMDDFGHKAADLASKYNGTMTKQTIEEIDKQLKGLRDEWN